MFFIRLLRIRDMLHLDALGQILQQTNVIFVHPKSIIWIHVNEVFQTAIKAVDNFLVLVEQDPNPTVLMMQGSKLTEKTVQVVEQYLWNKIIASNQ